MFLPKSQGPIQTQQWTWSWQSGLEFSTNFRSPDTSLLIESWTWYLALAIWMKEYLWCQRGPLAFSLALNWLITLRHSLTFSNAWLPSALIIHLNPYKYFLPQKDISSAIAFIYRCISSLFTTDENWAIVLIQHRWCDSHFQSTVGNSAKVWFQNLLPQTTSGAKCLVLNFSRKPTLKQICMHVDSWKFSQKHSLQGNEGSRTE